MINITTNNNIYNCILLFFCWIFSKPCECLSMCVYMRIFYNTLLHQIYYFPSQFDFIITHVYLNVNFSHFLQLLSLLFPFIHLHIHLTVFLSPYYSISLYSQLYILSFYSFIYITIRYFIYSSLSISLLLQLYLFLPSTFRYACVCITGKRIYNNIYLFFVKLTMLNFIHLIPSLS